MASEMDAMDGADPGISNGTCWSEKNIKASDYFIPCGNAAGPDLNFACCYTGDTCLSRNSCYNAIYGITYIVGCTDQNYSAAVCGDKGNYSNQEWVGLVRCYVSDDLTAKDEEWAGCQEDCDVFPVIPRACDCEGKQYLFKDNKALTATAKVPLSSGGSISSMSDYQPTVTQIATVSATSWETAEGPPIVTGAPTQLSAPGAIAPAATLAAGGQDPLSTGAEIGVAVGAGAAGLFVFGLIIAYVLRGRRKEVGQRTAPLAPKDDGERGELETDANSRRLEGGPVWWVALTVMTRVFTDSFLVSHAEHNEDDEPHTSQHGRNSRQYLYGSRTGHRRYPSDFQNHRLSTISEHSTVPDPQSPGSSKVPVPPPQAVVSNGQDSTGGSALGKGHPVERQTHELPG